MFVVVSLYILTTLIFSTDSVGNTQILKRGDLQLTSAGTGITQSEKAYGSDQVHLLQIWSLPTKARLEPHFFIRHFSDEEKTDKWAEIVAPVAAVGVVLTREGKGPTPVQSCLTMYATLLSPGKILSKTLGGKKGYIHVLQTSGYKEGKAEGASITIRSTGCEPLTLREGDGAYISVGQSGNTLEIENDGDRLAEVLAFDLD